MSERKQEKSVLRRTIRSCEGKIVEVAVYDTEKKVFVPVKQDNA